MTAELSSADDRNSRSEPVASGTDSRATILAAAMTILQREGAGAMTVRSVAAAAGCSTTGVYTWFGGKAGLVEAIFIDGFERFGESLRMAQRGAPADRPMDGLAQAYRSWALANPTQYMVMFGHAVPDYHPSDHASLVALATFDDLVAATTLAMSTAGVTGDPVDIAHHLWAGIHGYVSLELAGMDIAPNESVRAARFDAGVDRLLQSWLR